MLDRVSRRPDVWLVAILCGAATYGSQRVTAQDVVVERGSLDLLDARSIGSGNLFIGGTRGFTFRTRVDNRLGELEPEFCELGCAPGTTVGIGARWSGAHLPGMVTFDGAIYPVGDLDIMSVEFAGSVVVPDAPGGASLKVPFSFSGEFRPALRSWMLSGSGTATVVLQPINTGLQIASINYSFGPINLPDAWISTGTSEVPISYPTTMFTSAMFIVGGMGDFWGTTDGGHLAARPVSGDAQIVARVRDQSGTDSFAKAGVMLRQSIHERAAHVILDLKPDGGIEFMARNAAGQPTEYLAGAFTPGPDPWLKLVRTGDLFTGWLSVDAVEWMEVGSIIVPMGPDIVAALAVSSHNFSVVNTAIFDEVAVLPEEVPVDNLLFDGGFEVAPPAALNPWWVSDYPFRETPAKRESFQPRTGTNNGACWTPEYLDCGIYTEVTAQKTATYTLTFYATADRPGGLVGANVNGATAAFANVEPRGWRNYGEPYVMTFTAEAGQQIRVWMYSPATPGYVVIDDVTLTMSPTATTGVDAR